MSGPLQLQRHSQNSGALHGRARRFRLAPSEKSTKTASPACLSAALLALLSVAEGLLLSDQRAAIPLLLPIPLVLTCGMLTHLEVV